MADTKKDTFESNLAKLEKIVDELSTGNLPLAKMVELYEEGAKLSKKCMEMLEEYDGRIEMIDKQAGLNNE